ncbi:MAG: phosphatidate cytidylyltransferase [Pirellulales bacterium]|nr:phosphatidate cytidylyltransferase [Pirellulales bacterium]
MLRWRLILGFVFIAALVALLTWDHSAANSPESFASGKPGFVLIPLALVLAWLASGEFVSLAKVRGLNILESSVRWGSVVIVAASSLPIWWTNATSQSLVPQFAWPLLALLASTLAAFLVEMRRFEKPGHVIDGLGASVLGIVYVGGLLACVAQMRFLGLGGIWGVPALASLVIVVKAGDVGAYTLGRLFGKHKMTPVLSPGKTWEGALGALIFGCLGSWLSFEFLLPRACPDGQLPSLFPAAWLVYGVLLTPLGMAGDLAESLLKRDAGRKDSSHWLPGFGGVLDILDSILFASPVALAFWLLFA